MIGFHISKKLNGWIYIKNFSGFMGITKNLGKLGVFVLIIITLAILAAGCINKSETAQQEIEVSAPEPTITSTPTPTLTPEIPKVAKLKIMSVTTEPATLGGIPIIVKVKNIGDYIAKDVYAGGIKINYIGSWDKYPQKEELINQTVHNVLINGSSSIDTGFVYNAYMFAWNEFMRNSIERQKFQASMKEYFGFDWLVGAKEEKINNGSTIRLTKGNRNLSLTIDNDKTKINLEIDDGSMDELIVIKKNGVYYTTNTSRFGGLMVYGTLSTKDYLGDILPDETKTAYFTAPIDDLSKSGNYYLKVAWIDGTKEYTIY